MRFSRRKYECQQQKFYSTSFRAVVVVRHRQNARNPKWKYIYSPALAYVCTVPFYYDFIKHWCPNGTAQWQCQGNVVSIAWAPLTSDHIVFSFLVDLILFHQIFFPCQQTNQVQLLYFFTSKEWCHQPVGRQSLFFQDQLQRNPCSIDNGGQ